MIPTTPTNEPHGHPEPGPHPWLEIDLDVYERHMAAPGVGQLECLHRIMREQLADYPVATIGVLGVAGGNGLDNIDPSTIDSVDGYDINPEYLRTCATRYSAVLGHRLRLIETQISRTLRIDPTDLLIANLIIEYIGVVEFTAFAAANADNIGVLTCVAQRNDAANFVSSSPHASSFKGLAAISSDVDAGELAAALAAAGFTSIAKAEYPLPNAKTFVRQDFRFGTGALNDQEQRERW